MPKTIPAAGEAMPNDRMYDLLDDAQNKLSEIKDFNEAIFMASHGIDNRRQMNAVATMANLIDQKIEIIEQILAAAQEAAR